MMQSRGELPHWVDVGLIPLINLAVALAVAGLVVVIIGENPVEAMWIMLKGAVGSLKGWGYLLYYATTFVFTGLAVAVAFHAGLFNIGGEGQAYMAGVGAAAVGLGLEFLPWPILIPLAILASMAMGAFWAWIPGVLQAKRGSHIVITTIMFNFIAAALMTYIMVYVLIVPGQQSPESRQFDASTFLPTAKQAVAWIGVDIAASPLNLSFVVALVAAVLVWVFVWHTYLGYELRVVGKSEKAAVYSGISPARRIVLAMAISGALAGLVGLNEIMGVQHRLLLNFTGGVGYVGIAVALMGRNHPFGICLAALLFGALYQGGSELAFSMPQLSKEMVVVIQGLVILFCGALEHLFRPQLERLFAKPLPART